MGNALQVAGVILMVFGAYVIIRGIARAISSPKSPRRREQHISAAKRPPTPKQAICPACKRTALVRRATFLKCQSCWFVLPPSWLSAILTPLPLAGCALLVAKWIGEAERRAESAAGSGLLESAAFWLCLGFFAALLKLTTWSDRLGRGR